MDSVIATNIQSLEFLLQIKSKSHDVILDDYMKATNERQISSLYSFLLLHYSEELHNDKSVNIFDELLLEFLINKN